jgi:hypothetical protein
MSNRSLFASILLACLLAVGSGGLAPAANAASAGQSLLKAGESAANPIIEIGYRGRGPRVVFPIGPSYRAHDYPYYFSRGYYPTHIGPGYIGPYYSYRPAYSYGPAYSPRSGRRCSYWHRRCAANWGYGNEDYDGCMAFHRCE